MLHRYNIHLFPFQMCFFIFFTIFYLYYKGNKHKRKAGSDENQFIGLRSERRMLIMPSINVKITESQYSFEGSVCICLSLIEPQLARSRINVWLWNWIAQLSSVINDIGLTLRVSSFNQYMSINIDIGNKMSNTKRSVRCCEEALFSALTNAFWTLFSILLLTFNL